MHHWHPSESQPVLGILLCVQLVRRRPQGRRGSEVAILPAEGASWGLLFDGSRSEMDQSRFAAVPLHGLGELQQARAGAPSSCDCISPCNQPERRLGPAMAAALPFAAGSAKACEGRRPAAQPHLKACRAHAPSHRHWWGIRSRGGTRRCSYRERPRGRTGAGRLRCSGKGHHRMTQPPAPMTLIGVAVALCPRCLYVSL